METESRESSSYYSVLGVSSDSSIAKIKQAYRRLAMQWHPDRWTRTPSLLTQAKRKFQQIQEAYSVLSDEKKRALYDIGLYDPAEEEEEEDEGYSEFLQEMVSLIAQERRQNKTYNMEELQTMFTEMVQGFQQTPPMSYNYTSPALDASRDSKRARCEFDSNVRFDCGVPQFSVSNCGFCK